MNPYLDVDRTCHRGVARPLAEKSGERHAGRGCAAAEQCEHLLSAAGLERHALTRVTDGAAHRDITRASMRVLADLGVVGVRVVPAQPRDSVWDAQ